VAGGDCDQRAERPKHREALYHWHRHHPPLSHVAYARTRYFDESFVDGPPDYLLGRYFFLTVVTIQRRDFIMLHSTQAR
jgi:hypothetical protein